mgnify:CR=1 FL=1
MLVQLESAKSVAYSAVRTDTSDDLEVEMSALLAKSDCSEVLTKSLETIFKYMGELVLLGSIQHIYFLKKQSLILYF